MQKKKYITGLLSLLIMLAAYAGYRLYEGNYTQTVLIRAVSEGAIGSNTAVSDKIHLETVSAPEKLLSKNNIIPGFTYQVTVRYNVVKKQGKGLFSKTGERGNTAYLGCSEMETNQRVMATGKFLAIDLVLVAEPADIVDSDGNTFNPETMKLQPVITIEELGLDKE